MTNLDKFKEVVSSELRADDKIQELRKVFPCIEVHKDTSGGFSIELSKEFLLGEYSGEEKS